MKNKKMLYILVPVVALVWGLVIFKILSYTSDNQVVNYGANYHGEQDSEKVVRDSFSIIADYRDPFLENIEGFNLNLGNYLETDQDGNPLQNNDQQINNGQKKNEKPVPERKIKWPELNYNGLVKNNKSSDVIGLFKINKKDYLIKKGDIIENIRVSNIYNDSICVEYMEDVKTIIRN